MCFNRSAGFFRVIYNYSKRNYAAQAVLPLFFVCYLFLCFCFSRFSTNRNPYQSRWKGRTELKSTRDSLDGVAFLALGERAVFTPTMRLRFRSPRAVLWCSVCTVLCTRFFPFLSLSLSLRLSFGFSFPFFLSSDSVCCLSLVFDLLRCLILYTGLYHTPLENYTPCKECINLSLSFSPSLSSSSFVLIVLRHDHLLNARTRTIHKTHRALKRRFSFDPARCVAIGPRGFFLSLVLFLAPFEAEWCIYPGEFAYGTKRFQNFCNFKLFSRWTLLSLRFSYSRFREFIGAIYWKILHALSTKRFEEWKLVFFFSCFRNTY